MRMVTSLSTTTYVRNPWRKTQRSFFVIFTGSQFVLLLVHRLKHIQATLELRHLHCNVVGKASRNCRQEPEVHVGGIASVASILDATQSVVDKLVWLRSIWGWPDGNGGQLRNANRISYGMRRCRRVVLPTENTTKGIP